MRQRKKLFPHLLLGILFLLLFILIISLFSPNQPLRIFTTDIPLLPFFFLFFFLSVYFLATYIFASKKHGLLLGLFFIIYLIFRQNDLTHPLFLVLLIGLFLILELLFSRKS